MGEAVYYGKIRFETKGAAEAAYPEIKALILETCLAGEYWQNNRHQGDKDAFWRGMEAEFPLASDYLKSIDSHYGAPTWDGDHNNGLAGLLDLIGYEGDIDGVRLNENEISWASEVWHFADWEPFRDYIEGKYSCEMRWLSDEYLDIEYLLDAEFSE